MSVLFNQTFKRENSAFLYIYVCVCVCVCARRREGKKYRKPACNINIPRPKRIAKENPCIELLLYTEFWLEFGNQQDLLDRQ